jgi:prolipoprotein diacylglyceryltransferase
LPHEAEWSLPVHPLQLYFLLAAAVTVMVLHWQRGQGGYPGYIQLLFYALFFGATTMLEQFRQNSLALNNLLAPAAAALAGGLLVGVGAQHTTVPKPSFTASAEMHSGRSHDAAGVADLTEPPIGRGELS